MRLGKIENGILEIKKVLADKEREKRMASGVPQQAFEAERAQANRPLLEELDTLETERGFKIEQRNSFLWRAVWNVAVPIIVSTATAYLVSRFVF